MRRPALCLTTVFVIVACNGQARPGPDEPGATLHAPAADVDGMVKVLLYYDMEGLSGQGDWRSYFFSFPEPYAQGRARLMADLNATIDGLFAGGADSVHVYDAHGSGNPEPDAVPGLLDPRAELLVREPGDGGWVTALARPGAWRSSSMANP